MSKYTQPQRHALILLAIQEANRGWVRQGILKSCGVTIRTLSALRRHDAGRLVELDITPKPGMGEYNWRWRLTGAGEREAAKVRERWGTPKPKHVEAITGIPNDIFAGGGRPLL